MALAILPTLLLSEDLPRKMAPEYLISYGKENAPIHVVEHFLLDCPFCLKLIARDFPSIKKAYIDTGWVRWTFHLEPLGLMNFQALVCLSTLSLDQRKSFFTFLIRNLRGCNKKNPALLMQSFMTAQKSPLPQLHRLDFLETTPAWNEAMSYLSQKNLPAQFPTFEINRQRLLLFKKPRDLTEALNALIEKSKGEMQ